MHECLCKSPVARSSNGVLSQSTTSQLSDLPAFIAPTT
jgi:hypothetical protein